MCGPELFVALDANRRLRDAEDQARQWNETKDGQSSPVPPEAFLELQAETFREPEALFRDDNLKPETLARIASPLLKEKWPELTAGDAVRRAHEILIEAERYLAALPAEKQGIEKLIHELEQGFSRVSFAEILRSSDEGSGQVPLLGGVAKKRAALSAGALKMAVRRYFEREKQNRSRVSKREWNRQVAQRRKLIKPGAFPQLANENPQTYHQWQRELDNEINDSLQNKQITLQRLCDLRWQRFITFLENQSARRRTATAKQMTSKS